MGYPMLSGYRNGAGQASSGLSYEASSTNSVAQMFTDRLDRLPANDIAKRNIKLWLRANPWLSRFMSVYDAYSHIYAPQPSPIGAVPTCGGGGKGPFFGEHNCGQTILGNDPPGVQYQVSWPWFMTARWHLKTFLTNDPLLGELFVASASYAQFQWFNPASHFGDDPQPWQWVQTIPGGLTYVPGLSPEEVPWVNPWDLPIANPVPAQRPLPWEVTPTAPRPWDDPSPVVVPPGNPKTAPDVDPGPVVVPPFDPLRDPNYRPRERPQPRPRPRPRTRPSPFEPIPRVVRTRIGPGQYAELVIKGSPPLGPRNFPKPPPRGEKEIKVKGAGAGAGRVWAVANAITEARDFIKSVHKALPKRYRTPTKSHGIGKFRSANAPTVQQMFKDIYRGISDMKQSELGPFTNKAIDNLIADQIKDYVFGRFGQAIARQSRADRRPIGYQAGPAL